MTKDANSFETPAVPNLDDPELVLKGAGHYAETIDHGLGYTDFAQIDKQTNFVKQYAAPSVNHMPPKPDMFCSNDNAGKVVLMVAEWDQVRANTQKYAKLLHGT